MNSAIECLKYDEPPPSIYWGGCAFGSAFYVGVYHAMVERWGPDFHKKVLMSGGSAGTIFALGLALGKDPAYMDDLYATVARKTLQYSPVYFGSYYMEEKLREMLSDPMAYKQIEGRCCFGTTAFFSEHRWHVSWESNEDLIACVRASYHIPLYCKWSAGIKGVECVDGAYGFAGIHLPHGDRTLYVGIDPHAEITRTLTHNEMFYPCIGAEYAAMVESGRQQMKQWDGRMNRKVGSRQPNYSALYVLWTLKVLENFVYSLFFTCHKVVLLLIALIAAVTSIGTAKPAFA